MTREDKAKEEMAWRKINEDIELEREGVEPLLDSYFVYSTEVWRTQRMQFVVFFFWWGRSKQVLRANVCDTQESASMLRW